MHWKQDSELPSTFTTKTKWIVWYPILIFVFHYKEQSSVVRQLGLCHRANKDAKDHVSLHICGAVSMNWSKIMNRHPRITRLLKRLEQKSGRWHFMKKNCTWTFCMMIRMVVVVFAICRDYLKLIIFLSLLINPLPSLANLSFLRMNWSISLQMQQRFLKQSIPQKSMWLVA